jgi:hypothetical protein
MQKIIIDTNVFVSALIQRSYPFYVGFTQKRLLNCKCVVYLNCLNYEYMHLLANHRYPVHCKMEFAHYVNFLS